MKPTQKQAHLQTAHSLHADPSLQKSLLCQCTFTYQNSRQLTNRQEGRTANRRLAQWRVTWLIEHSTSHQLLWCIDSFVLQNPPLRQAPKRCASVYLK